MEYIESLRIFRSVVELKSFTRAADIHGLARPAVSRAIAGLEERIGCRLLNRTTRQVSLTEAAERFYEGCVRILDDLDLLEADVANQTREAGGVLRLVAHTTATVSRLVPLIAGFKRAHPKVTLDVTLTERPVDLVGDGFDLGLVLPYMLTSETTVVRLLERIPVVIVATPQYLQTSSTPGDPSELAEHLFVPMSPSIRRPAIGFRIGEDELSVPLRFDVSSNSPAFNLEMVLQGFGIGVVPAALVENELASGKLVQLLTGSQLVDNSVEIQLAYSNRTLLPAKVRAFIDYAAAFFETLATSR
ncbi:MULTISPECIES: LysR family transcriptional regulator [Paraburkholderia]|uniref:LysR family transcriptional regulator n=1 Tax=Paraburkholderia madseniana TaxID=2599607 RepID=A0AAP5B7Z8_9BURK|nr:MULTISPECIES: LysR family transcriptional regulator [Paraburkholderia]MCX4144836.1 LysR family transcriptional regulator [Paraburkholderia madseniana]MDN7147788.1 LysR family transcriptional regulator [Paraburkholderia sp. WS6]MDQ6406668.1 LysR family transcriptional regulator [Paraburkholderia madseniana]